MTISLGRNNPCPCASGLKYKKCCFGKIDWSQVSSVGGNAFIEYLSARGKNIVFYNLINDALQLDSEIDNIQQIKKACTPNAVRKIHQAIIDVWPNKDDLSRILKEERKNNSGLYVGHYEPDIIFQGVTRHSLYSDVILLIDPFTDPRAINPKFSPIIHPKDHIETTLKNIRLWFMLMPWVEEGIVRFIKTPGDLDASLNIECMKKQENRLKEHPELDAILDNVEVPEQFKHEFELYNLIALPDSVLKDKFKKSEPDATDRDISNFLKYINKEREVHPYFVPFITDDKKQIRHPIHVMNSGANYEMAKLTASITNSHILTDISYRWKEMELDRSELKSTPKDWDSFSKAFQGIDLKYLNNIPLEFALDIRKKNYLSTLRSFFIKLWNNTNTAQPLNDENIELLKSELMQNIQEAESEWDSIDRDIMKRTGYETAALATAVVSGQADLLSAGIGFSLGGLTELGVAWHKRSKFNFRYPGGLFLKLKRK